MVFTLAMRITANRETAEELTVDVFHDVWRRAAGYDAANGTVLGWIMNQARSGQSIVCASTAERSAVTAATFSSNRPRLLPTRATCSSCASRENCCARRWRCSRRPSARRSKRRSSPG